MPRSQKASLPIAGVPCEAVVCELVRVRSWQVPGGHVTGSQPLRVTGGAEAEYPPDNGEQSNRPQRRLNPEASIFSP
jgi:hypothetical protein